MPLLKIPASISTSVEAHKKWLEMVKRAQDLIEEDIDLQQKSAKFLRLKERNLPPEVLGRNYALYCNLINQMYDAYLNSIQMQRSAYMLEIISVFIKRLYELREELVHVIVNDYIYVDAALSQLKITPYDIQIVFPYHIPLECRPDSMEQLLQQMWTEAVKRKNAPPVVQKPPGIHLAGSDEDLQQESFHRVPSSEEISLAESVHTIIPEEYVQASIIQKQERFRQYFMQAYRAKCIRRRMYFAEKMEEAPLDMKIKAAALIQMVYRRIIMIKRERVIIAKRDVLLGLIPDPNKRGLNFEEENNKMYERRRRTRQKVQEAYQKELVKENVRLIVFKKDNQIDDITEQVREWFREWFYGYGFFPEFPYELEGGTVMVMTGAYPTIAEKIEADEKYLAATKGKTKEQLKQEKDQAKLDAILKAEIEKENKKKEKEQELKLKCNPFSDPGYKAQQSAFTGEISDALLKYRAAWSLYDRFPAETCAETIYGYMKPLITEELMCQLHKECRKYVDELMRLDLKLLIKMHQLMYKNVGWKYPKQVPRKRPKTPPLPKQLNVDSTLLKSLEEVFDLGIISKPTSKIKDIFGDLNFAAYDLNIRDPDAKFPPPAYGDVKRRLLLSCVFGSGIEPGAKRNKAVLLVGPPRNGKSFLVDCVAGEMNGVKIDISPEVFSAVSARPAKVLSQVFIAAKLFQPAVIYCRDFERVFAKKVPPQDKWLNAKILKAPLTKLLKLMLSTEKIIFIATCTNPLSAQAKPMVSIFNELLLVPRTDYGTLQMFFSNKLQRIQSLPQDYCVQDLAQLLQGYGSGLLMQLYNEVMNSERIARLNITPLSATEFLEPLLMQGLEPVTLEDFKEYSDFVIKNSPLATEREEFEFINIRRDDVYKKMAKKAAEKEREKEKKQQ